MRLACLVRGERRHVNDRSEMAGRADTLCNEHHLLGERYPPHIRWILPVNFWKPRLRERRANSSKVSLLSSHHAAREFVVRIVLKICQLIDVNRFKEQRNIDI
jgi:hypothetical protein